MKRSGMLILWGAFLLFNVRYGAAEELFPIDAAGLKGEALPGAIGLILMAFLPFLKSWISFSKYKKALFWVRIAVYAAEKRYGSGQGGKKLVFTQQMLSRRRIHLDMETLHAMVDAEIERMERGLPSD